MAAKEKKFKLGPIQKAWVRALRSGKYKQGRERLTALDENGDPKEHCCLGVLCQLAIKKGVPMKVLPFTEGTPRLSYDGERAVLPRKVRNWAMVRWSSGDFGTESLAGLNDSGKSFKKIADTIEKHAAELFTRSV
jgi:hypothetical protein